MFDGIVLGYDSEHILEKAAPVSPYFTYVNVTVDVRLSVFRPRKGMLLPGLVNKIGSGPSLFFFRSLHFSTLVAIEMCISFDMRILYGARIFYVYMLEAFLACTHPVLHQISSVYWSWARSTARYLKPSFDG